jgi:hypothetical protein
VSGAGGVDATIVEEARARLLNLVNNFFYDKMTALPELRAYIASMMDG